MVCAAVRVGWISGDETGHSHLSFIMEGEARNGLVIDVIKVDYYLTFWLKIVLNTFTQSGAGLFTDAGGSTVDISAYRYVLFSTRHSSHQDSGWKAEIQAALVISTAMSSKLES